MPHDWPARLTEMSSRPPSIRRRISLRRDVGLHELGMRGEVVEQRLLIFRQAEEVVLLTDPLRRDRRVQRTAAVDEVLLLLELLTADAVPALVDAFVDVAGVVDAARQLGDAGPVPRLRRADEVVERESTLSPRRRGTPAPSGRSTPADRDLPRRAFLKTFCECSSLPIKNRVSIPQSRLYRAMTSATIFS